MVTCKIAVNPFRSANIARLSLCKSLLQEFLASKPAAIGCFPGLKTDVFPGLKTGVFPGLKTGVFPTRIQKKTNIQRSHRDQC